jgi:7-cyano-7-deazaguanine synthase
MKKCTLISLLHQSTRLPQCNFLSYSVRYYAKTNDIVLLSGGVESSTLLVELEQINTPARTTYPLFIDYAQRGADMEYKAAKAVCKFVCIEQQLEYLDMTSVGQFFRERQKEKLHVPIPHRNLMLLSMALGYASQIHNKDFKTDPQVQTALHLALISEDFHKPNYASGSSSFIEAFMKMAETLDSNVRIELPYKQYSKQQVIQRGLDLGLDYDITYTCMLGYEKPCGTCMQCKSRAQAFSLVKQN